MRYFLLTVLFLIIIYFSNAATRKWDGGGDGLSWNDPLNWDTDLLPLAADDVLLDNSIIAGNYSVNLPAGTILITVNTLTINPSGTFILLVLPASNTSNPGMSITGAGDAIVLNNGAILRNSSGASAGSGISLASTFRINNGGHYIHNTPRANAAIVSQLSTANGTEYGEFEFDIPAASYTPSFSGRTFGSLTLSAVANGGSATYIGNGANTLTIKGNLKINSGVNVSIGMSADFLVKGNLDQSTGSVFNLQSSTNNNSIKIQGHLSVLGTITESNTGLPVLELNGTANQNINIPGSILNSVTVRINNPAGVTLVNPLSLPYQLVLTNGKIKTTAAFLLILKDNATCSAGSISSFVEGPMKKIGDESFLFPTGAGGIYAPLGITNGSGQLASDEFTAEYKRSDPRSVNGPVVQPGQHHISYVEYWTLSRESGNSTKIVSLAVNLFTSFCYSLNQTYVSRFSTTGPYWTGEPTSVTFNGPASFPFESGTISTNIPLNSFGEFTLITDLPDAANPLPLKLTGFEVTSKGTTAVLGWRLESGCTPAVKFEVQRSFDNINFITIRMITGNTNQTIYSFTDSSSFNDILYYRLRITDTDGKVSFSRVIAINGDRDLFITRCWPNPAKNTLTLVLQASRAEPVDIIILDFSGRVMKIGQPHSHAGSNTFILDIQTLPRGIYQVVVSSAMVKTSFRFIKQ
jgi:hypothetical protein